MFGSQGKQVSVDVGAGCHQKRWLGNARKQINNTEIAMGVRAQTISGNGLGMRGREDISRCVGSTLVTDICVEPCHVK